MNSEDITRNMLDKIRNLQESCRNSEEKHMLNEETIKSNGIAISDDPRFGENVLTNQIQQFRASVESGAQFAKVDENNVSDSPLIYIPETGNLIFSGIIPCLLKTTTGNGCFLWCDGMILSKDNIQILNKLYGFYQNWKEQWNMSSSDLEAMANIINND